MAESIRLYVCEPGGQCSRVAFPLERVGNTIHINSGDVLELCQKIEDADNDLQDNLDMMESLYEAQERRREDDY